MKKKFLAVLLAACTLFSLTTGCSSDDDSKNNTAQNTINIACMKGPTGIGMIKLISDSDDEKSVNHYNYSIVGTADEISTGLVKGDLDIAAVPCNLASVLYNKTEGEIVTVAINTLGVLYIVEAGESVNEITDLKGKTIYSTGQGTTPEYTLRYLLSQAGIDPDNDVDIQFKSEAPEVLASLTNDQSAVAMLPQPYVTTALNSNENMRIALDVTAQWEELVNSTVVTGVLVARKSYIEENKEAFDAFLSEYKASTTYANEHIDETATLLEKYDVFKAAIAKKAIPYCNVVFINGDEMKDKALAYLKVLYDQNPKAIGGSLEEGMFYIEK
ncbi:MAG: ABC transporter substrate-binding protein [Lachnospiraceae bacterium]|nr:ABC transporter substrate-binding protein [Lachnospiraceae bacterium]